MRVMRLVCALAFVALAFAGESETDVENASELTVPTLPGLGSGCLPLYAQRDYRSRGWKRQSKQQVVAWRGQCVSEATCSAVNSEPGYCAGIGVTCCITAAPVDALDHSGAPAVDAAAADAAAPILRNGATPCSTQGGVCQDMATCKGTVQSGLCPGLPNNIRCCFSSSTPTPTRSLSTLVAIPSGINPGMTRAGASAFLAKIGRPGCPLTASCFDCQCAATNSIINNNKITLAVTPNVRITGVRPFVEAVKRALDAVKAAGATNPELLNAYNSLKTAGGLCCRPIKRSNGTPGSSWSNHSWGVAVDFYFGASIDPRGDGKTQYGLLLIAPFFAKEKLYWAAGYSGSEEDAMHFEASKEFLAAWKI